MAPERHPSDRRRRQGRGPHFTASPDGRLWLTLPLDADWTCYVRFVSQDGHPAVAELRILPCPTTDLEQQWTEETLHLPASLDSGKGHIWYDGWPQEPEAPEGGLTSRALRGVHLGRAVELAYASLGEWFERANRSPELADWLAFTEDAAELPRRPGRRGRDDAFYATVAAAYVEALARGSQQPVKDAARALSEAWKGAYTDAYVRDLLHVARQRELLTRPPRGRAGGELTEKAIFLLGERPTSPHARQKED